MLSFSEKKNIKSAGSTRSSGTISQTVQRKTRYRQKSDVRVYRKKDIREGSPGRVSDPFTTKTTGCGGKAGLAKACIGGEEGSRQKLVFCGRGKLRGILSLYNSNGT
jgi:hypothetical protein